MFFFNAELLDSWGWLVAVFQGRRVAGANVAETKLTHSRRATVIIISDDKAPSAAMCESSFPSHTMKFVG